MNDMKRQIIISRVAFALALVLFGFPSQADEAHHITNATKVKKSKVAKPKQTKKPAAKLDKSSRGETAAGSASG